MTTLAREILDRKGRVRRSELVRQFMGNEAFMEDKEKYPKRGTGRRHELRLVATNIMSDLTVKGLCNPFYRNNYKPKPGEKRTGSGDVKYWEKPGR